MSEVIKPKVLLFCDYYLPGYKSGGGVRTIVNIVERLGDEFDFRIVCRDHDGLADKKPYTTVKINEWNEVGKAKVFYLSPEKIKLSEIKKLINETEPKSIYTNSFFSTFTVFILLLRRFRRIKKIPLIISPGGELSKGAMRLKKEKKKLYLTFAHALGLYQNIIWRASAKPEAEDINIYKGKGGKVFLASDLPQKIIFPDYKQEEKPIKQPGELRLVYLSRIHQMKNLMFLLKLLEKINGKVLLDIYGPFEKPKYVEECKNQAAKLPDNILTSFRGEVHNDDVSKIISKYHLFCLPTLGESFGHIIIEALSGGCPILISDRTPWRNLSEKQVGWDLPLEEPEKWLEILKYCVNLGNEDYLRLSVSAREFAVKWLSDESVVKSNRELFSYSLSVT
jgi:glycosyltransferase involved in cell wall biosynthesis